MLRVGATCCTSSKTAQHGGRAADQLAEPWRRAGLLAEKTVLEAEAGELERATDHELERVDVEGLLEVVDRPELHRLDRGRHRPVPGQHDHRHVRVDRAELAKKLDASLARHLQVGDDEVATRGAKRGQGLVGAGRRFAFQTHLLGEDLQDAPHPRVVVDDQETLHA